MTCLNGPAYSRSPVPLAQSFVRAHLSTRQAMCTDCA